LRERSASGRSFTSNPTTTIWSRAKRIRPSRYTNYGKRLIPATLAPYINLGAIYDNLGQHEKAVHEGLEALRLERQQRIGLLQSRNAYINLNQFDKADEILNEAKAHKSGECRSSPAFAINWRLRATTRKRWSARFGSMGGPGIEGWLRALQADTEAYHGRLANAREYTRRAIASARHDGDEETALDLCVIGALREAEFGNRQLAKSRSRDDLRMIPDNKC
jgi:tetratricopeptide (TPR) repeat protein